MAYLEIKVPQPFTNPEGLIEIPRLHEGIAADWDADTLALADGAQVTSWAASGSVAPIADTTVGSGGYPTLETQDGHRVVRFDGNQGIRAAGDVIPDTSDMSFAIVARTVSGTGYLWDSDRTNDPFGQSMHVISSGHVWQFNTSGSSIRVSSGVPPSPGWVALVGRKSGSTARMIGTPFEGEVITTDVPDGRVNDLSMGVEYRGYSRATADIAALRFYDRAITDYEATNLLGSLTARYGV